MIHLIALLATLVMFLFPVNVLAEDSQNIVDMYNIGSPTFTGGYFSPVAKSTEFIDQGAYIAGGRLGVVISDSLLIGAGAYKLVSNIAYNERLKGSDPKLRGYGIAANEIYRDDREFNFSYGAAYVGWTFFPRKVVNLTLLTNVGWGAIKLDRPNYDTQKVNSEFDNIEVIEPELFAEMNVTSNVRFGFGASYRYIRGLDFDEISLNEVQGVSGLMTVTFHEGLASSF